MSGIVEVCKEKVDIREIFQLYPSKSFLLVTSYKAAFNDILLKIVLYNLILPGSDNNPDIVCVCVLFVCVSVHMNTCQMSGRRG